MAGYHINNIKKGVLGEPSKIQEELDELNDALEQGNKIMALVEMSDIYGALKAAAEKYNISMEQLKIMNDSTERAFKNGYRKENINKNNYNISKEASFGGTP